jgi:hypothetical protein
MNTPLHAQQYLELGFAVVPIPAGTKAPKIPQWQHTDFTATDFRPENNIGLVLGARSQQLVDVDHDCPEAITLGALLLPPTAMVHGRTSKPDSHRYYIAGISDTVRYKDSDGSTLIELRGNGQTVVPPSIHPSGEAITWTSFGTPASVEATILRQAVRRIAALALLARHWPKGSRHECAMALAGYLSTCGLADEQVIDFVGYVARAAGDEEEVDRRKAAQDTVQKHGQRVTGGPTLVQLLGEPVLRKLHDWLELPAHPTQDAQPIVQPEIMTARQLSETVLEPTRTIIGGMLIEGVTLLAAKQKIGKSWLILNLALAISRGLPALGKLPTEQGEVLYVSLEDNEAAMQERLEQLLGKEEAPETLYITHDWPLLNDDGIHLLEGFLDEHPQTRLVVFDTLARVRPPMNSHANSYYEDYHTIAPLKAVADKYKIAIVLVHHFRKAEGADPYDAVSGSSGLTAAADATMLLTRQRQQMIASLALTGRTIREQELALAFSDTGQWVLLGEASQVRRSEFEHEALLMLHEHGPMTPTEYALRTGRKHASVKVQLSRMVSKKLITHRDGRYAVNVLTRGHEAASRVVGGC